MTTSPSNIPEAAELNHTPRPGPQYWDFKCLECDEPVSAHAPLWLRIARKIGLTK